jgi:NhaA family Na+:H+ antiporter
MNQDILGGLLLTISCLLAFMLANSSFGAFYDALLQSPLIIQFRFLKLEKPLILCINDGLMTLFFLLVGLEIKREILKGRLSDPAVVIMPVISAACGVAVPALIYLAFNHTDPIATRGWGIPVATDIAFSLAVISLLGTRIPVGLKVFLTALAIIDDIGAIVIIAFFYTSDLSLLSLAWAGSMTLILIFLNRLGVKKLAPYMLIGFILWLSVLRSGVHATLSGILLSLVIPLEGENDQSPLIRLEQALLPWVNWFILPVFAFANSGFHLSGLTWNLVVHPTTLGIVLGLVIGKQTGIFSSCYFLVKLGIGKLPEGVNWIHLYGMSLLCGIGFTMSLFIGSLAFEHQTADWAIVVRFGVLSGSIISACLGLAVLALFSPKNSAHPL